MTQEQAKQVDVPLEVRINGLLGGGFNYLLCSPLFG